MNGYCKLACTLMDVGDKVCVISLSYGLRTEDLTEFAAAGSDVAEVVCNMCSGAESQRQVHDVGAWVSSNSLRNVAGSTQCLIKQIMTQATAETVG